MGKATKRKSQGEPAPVAAAAPAGAAAASAGDAGLLDNLKSLDPFVRESSCVAIASVFAHLDYQQTAGGSKRPANSANWGAARQLLQRGLVKRLLQRLVDPVPGVRVHAAGALRNISAVGEPALCEAMVGDGVVTTALTQLEGVLREGSPVAAEHAQAIALQLLLLLSNIFEHVDAAVDSFTDGGGRGAACIAALLTAQAIASSPLHLAAALRLAHTATEGNAALCRALQAAPAAADALAALMAPPPLPPPPPAAAAAAAQPPAAAVTLAHQLQAAGVIVNMAAALGEDGGGSGAAAAAALHARLAAAAPPLVVRGLGAYDARLTHELAARADAERQRAQARSGGAGRRAGEGAAAAGGGGVAEMAVEGEGGGGGDGAGAGEEAKTEAELVEAWRDAAVEPVLLAAEVAANLAALAAAAAGNDDDGDCEWASDDEDGMEAEAATGGGSGGGAAGESEGSSAILQALAEAQVLPRVIDALGAAALAPPPPQPLPAAAAAELAELRASLAATGASLVEALPAKGLGDIGATWRGVCALVDRAAADAALHDCLEPLTGMMWGLVRRVPSEVAGAGDAASGALLQRLVDPAQTGAAEVRVNAVAMLAALAGAAAAGAGQADLAAALVRSLEDSHPLVQAAALNAAMDVWGSDSGDAAVFARAGLLGAIAAMLPDFKRKVKAEGSTHGREALCHLKETSLNAARFVKYMRSQK
ncbi:hypothetical protein JKP88DRAFT_261472 [Tribonema minus]|uniref:SYO1-like TPR repeats domain-containing protein n=1 Tax=Tribonema minus TaxID=303371 RepID=A0A835YUS0_9STRA|nr:hypothetical protein JKP88DRAFT_261472 [Tribonema minus]